MIITEEYLVHNRRLLDMPMDIIALLHDTSMTYEEAQTILEVTLGMVKEMRQGYQDNDIIDNKERINWDDI